MGSYPYDLSGQFSFEDPNAPGLPQRLSLFQPQPVAPSVDTQIPAPTVAPAGISADTYNPDRAAQIDEITKAISDLQKAQTQRALQASTKPSLTGDQALVTTIGALLPMVLGRAIAGAKGGVLGAQSGSQFATGALKNIDDSNKEDQARAKAEYDLNQIEYKDLISQKRELQKQDYAAADAAKLEKGKEGHADASREDQQAFLEAQQGRQQAFQKGLTEKQIAAASGRAADREGRQDMQLLGTEAARVRDRFMRDPVAKSAMASIQAADRIQNLLDNPSSVTAGAIGTQLAVLAGEVGVKTDQDIKRNLGPTAVGKITEMQNYLANNADSTLAPAQVQAIQQMVNALRPYSEKKLNLVRQDYASSGLAPYSAKTGKLDEILASLGQSAVQQANQPTAPAGGGMPNRADYGSVEEYKSALKAYIGK